MHPAVSSSLSYGLVVHLLLLSTTHCCVAVAFGYRPESVFLERTSTSLTTRAFRRTTPRVKPVASANRACYSRSRFTVQGSLFTVYGLRSLLIDLRQEFL